MTNHTSLRFDFALSCQRQLQRDQTLQSSYGLLLEVLNEIMDKVCNAWLNEIMDNHAKKKDLKGKGKPGLCTTLLSGEQRKQSADNCQQEAIAWPHLHIVHNIQQSEYARRNDGRRNKEKNSIV